MEERRITTLMITHNMASSLRLGNRTILIDSGSVAIDLLTLLSRSPFLCSDIH